jgi:hypothetical protein
MTGSAVDVNQPAFQFAANPVTRVSLDDDATGLHFAADVPTGVSDHADLAFGHFRPDPMDARQIAFPMYDAITGIADSAKVIAQRHLAVTVENRAAFDLR